MAKASHTRQTGPQEERSASITTVPDTDLTWTWSFLMSTVTSMQEKRLELLEGLELASHQLHCHYSGSTYFVVKAGLANRQYLHFA